MGTRYRAGLSGLALLIVAGCSPEAATQTSLEVPAWATEWTDEDYREVLNFCVAASEGTADNPGWCPGYVVGLRDEASCSPEAAIRLIGAGISHGTGEEFTEGVEELYPELVRVGECQFIPDVLNGGDDG